MNKLCKKCKVEKPETKEFFYFIKNTNKYNNICKECKNKYQKDYTKNNINKIIKYKKEYYLNNKENIHIKYEENKENKSKYNKDYYKNNIEQIKQRKRKYRKNNRKKINEYKRIYENNRRNNPAIALRIFVSNKIKNMLKSKKSSKNGKSITDYLLWNFNELVFHIENLFASWMHWDNWGIYSPETWDDNDPLTWTWQIDHIIPQSDLPYDSMGHSNFKKCWSLKNLRPLSAKQNIIDGANKTRHSSK